MKLTVITDENDRYYNRSYIERENENETILRHSFLGRCYGFGELFVPEGIEVIERSAFYGDLYYHTIHLPKSLVKLGEYLFSPNPDGLWRVKKKIVYHGTSEDFQKLAVTRTENVCESDGFDRSPYYSGGSRWVTKYHAFDSYAGEVTVECTEDGVTLLYGANHRKDSEPPRVKEP